MIFFHVAGSSRNRSRTDPDKILHVEGANKNQTRPTVPDFRCYKQNAGVRQFVWEWLISAGIWPVFQGTMSHSPAAAEIYAETYEYFMASLR